MMNVLVTGYGGFLGKHIAMQLVQAGYRVRGMARNDYPDLQAFGIERFIGDASKIDDCRRAIHGIDAVIHTAAIAGVWGPREEFERINVLSTENLLNVSQQERVGSFVYTSSPSVTFDGRPQSNIDESVPYPSRWLCDYPRTKAIAERLVLDRNQAQGMQTCSLRPHLIWGKGDPHLIPRLLDRCSRRKLMCVGSGKNLIDTVHVESAAKAHLLALQKLQTAASPVGGKAYFITDGEPIACWEWISSILRIYGMVPPKKRIPLAVAYRLGHALEILYRCMNKKTEPPMTRFVALQLAVDHYFNIDAARRDLDYHPNVDRDRVLATMVD